MSNQIPSSAVHPFGSMQDSSSSHVSKFTEREPLITPPPTVWTTFNARYRFGKHVLVIVGIVGIFIVMFIVLATLDVFHNKRYRAETGVSVGSTKYQGNSTGYWSEGNKAGSGDGTYYDPGVGLTACGTSFKATDYIVAMNQYDFGDSDDPNQSSTCGVCIIITGPSGTQKAQIQDICPSTGCGQGSVDMTPAVFNKVGDITAGRIPISWKQC